MICHECGQPFDTIKSLACHITSKHKMTTNDYYEKHLRKPGDNICPVCHGIITKRLGLLGFPKHCSTRCSTLDKETQKKKKETVKEKAKNTKKERYGDENFNNRALAENTNLERYGAEWYSKTADWKTKTQETCMQKYGVKYHCILNKSKKYWYDNRFFDSSWEIAYYIWLKDHNIQFEFHPDTTFNYVTADGKEHKYFPDFKIGDEFIEIKGNHLLENTWSPPEKISCIKEHGKILGAEEIKPYLNYILNKYGKNYLKQFKRQK